MSSIGRTDTGDVISALSTQVDLRAAATQTDLAVLVGTSQPAIAKHFAAGYLPEGGTLGEWLIAYCERLRLEAAGRTPSNSRERRDLAQAIEAEANAELKMREVWKQDQLLLDYESVLQLLMGWTMVAKNELTRAVNNVVSAIESKHSITVDRELPMSRIEAACIAIGNHADEFSST